MKTVTAKMLASLIGILLAAPFFAIALIIGARAVAVSQSAEDDLLLAALALAGAVASVINGTGRRTAREECVNGKLDAKENTLTRSASTIHLGY